MKKLLLLSAALLATASAMAATWGTTLNDPTAMYPAGTNQYGNHLCVCPDGSVWSVIYHPNTEAAEDETDVANVVYEWRVQHWDKDGNPSFPPEGLLVSNYKNKSYTVVSDHIISDSEGNAILAVSDRRNSNDAAESYTAYRITPEGKMLWGDEGKALSDATKPASLLAHLQLVALEDDSFVFAWVEFDETSASSVKLQRLNKDGEKQWNESKVSLLDDQCSYPYLVSTGDNTCILVYSRGSSQVIYARKLDFEGENVWGKDLRIYRGGFGSTPLHTMLNVGASGDGGAIVYWHDDRAMTDIESPYLSYITPDGKLGFAGASDEGDVKLGYDGMRCFNVDAVPSSDGSCFYAVWRETTANQNLQGVSIQKVSKSGELLWDENGVVVVPLEDPSTGYISIQTAADNQAMVFYELYKSWDEQLSYATLYDADGKAVWENPLQISRSGRQASGLESFPINNDAWYFMYTDVVKEGEEASVSTEIIGRLNLDGTFGMPTGGVESVSADASEIAFDGKILYAQGKQVDVYTTAGTHVGCFALVDGQVLVDLPAGLYVADVDGRTAIKLAVK